jgi:hypothetical protein
MGVTWERDLTAKAFEGIASAKINNLINTNYGQSDALVLPSLDFTTMTGQLRLFFNWAYAKSDPSYSDELIVLASKDCGVTWTQVFYRTGVSMTTGPTQTTPYMPDSTTVWKSAVINLINYSNDRNVQLKIVNVTDGGNNLYIDRIGVGLTPTGIEETPHDETIQVYPNPAHASVFVSIPQSMKAESVRVMNQMGQAIAVTIVESNQSQLQVDLPTGISAGMYFLKVETSRGAIVRKLLVQ